MNLEVAQQVLKANKLSFPVAVPWHCLAIRDSKLLGLPSLAQQGMA